MSAEFTRKLERKGNVVLLTEKRNPIELTDKNVLGNINNLRAELDKLRGNIEAAKQQIEDGERAIVDREEALKKFLEHEEWALSHQRSKARVLLKEEGPVVAARVREEYSKKWDPSMTLEQNRIQMFHIWRKYLVTCDKARDTLAESVVKECFFGPQAIVSLDENPFKEFSLADKDVILESQA